MARICGELGAGWTAVDVDTDPELRAEYGDRVPVIVIDGREHGFWRVEEPRFRARPAELMRPPQPVGPGRFRTRNGHRDETVPVSTTAAPPQPTRPARSGIPRGFAALIGVLAVGAALAAGQLVAGSSRPASSPFLAVGDTVIRFSPQFLTEFAKTDVRHRRQAGPARRAWRW